MNAKWRVRGFDHGGGGPVSGLPSSVAGHPEAEDGSLHSVPLLCQALPPGPARDAAVRLLSGTGRGAVGAIYALVDVAAEPGDPPPAAAVILANGDGDVELSDLVAPGPQGPDLAGRLLADVCDALRHSDVARLVVDTASPTVPPIEILERAGFRPVAVEHGLARFELRL